jgi:dephospho-CoA kinase
MPSHDQPVIGLVGGIGSGKSAVADAFAQLGCTVLDADRIGHQVLTRPTVRQAIRDRWGESVFDPHGQVNRRQLGQIVFADRTERAALEAIVHPHIRAGLEAGIGRARQGDAPAIVIDAAVLFEAGWDELCTHTVYVDAPREQRLQRVQAGRGWDEPTLASREACQFPLDRKAQLCCHTLVNRSSPCGLQTRVRQLLNRILHNSC